MQPIGIEKTLHYFIGKAVYSATCVYLESLCGADQLCGGIKSGIKGAIHAMNYLYSQNCTSADWGMLLVDASDAFNSLYCAALLWNACVLWLECSCFSSTPIKTGLHWLFEIKRSFCLAEKGSHRVTLCLCSCMLPCSLSRQ